MKKCIIKKIMSMKCQKSKKKAFIKKAKLKILLPVYTKLENKSMEGLK